MAQHIGTTQVEAAVIRLVRNQIWGIEMIDCIVTTVMREVGWETATALSQQIYIISESLFRLSIFGYWMHTLLRGVYGAFYIFLNLFC